MPIIRTYVCSECTRTLEVTLTLEQADAPPPECPHCTGQTQQEFKPFAIGGSASSRAHKLAEDIMEKDYRVADYKRDKYDGPRTRYQDQTTPVTRSQWSAATETINQAVAAGRRTRLQYGSGLDVLQANLKSGKEPDLIKESRKRLIRVF
jgi:DNA-directed RNA polymerase subunit RPC12/RpoP